MIPVTRRKFFRVPQRETNSPKQTVVTGRLGGEATHGHDGPLVTSGPRAESGRP